MLLIFVFFLLTIILSGITTIPFYVGGLVLGVVIYKKSWMFLVAFALGLILDLLNLRSLGYTSLAFTILIFIIWLYERKFETQTVTFVFFATLIGSLIYLMIFGYNNVLLQSLVSALLFIVFFKFYISSRLNHELRIMVI